MAGIAGIEQKAPAQLKIPPIRLANFMKNLSELWNIEKYYYLCLTQPASMGWAG